MMKGKFVISLDFELHWGAAELWDINKKKDYFDTTRDCIGSLLSLFEEHSIYATWATVGFLFAEDKEQLVEFLPTLKPTYKNTTLNYYSLIDAGQVGKDEIDDPYHFGHSLIKQIIQTPYQELASHTFAHFYCNEKGQTLEQFEADIKTAKAIAKNNFDIELQSLVLPRNQFNSSYINIIAKNGIKVIRSNPDVWFWKVNNKLTPLFRAIDTLMPISKSLTFNEKDLMVEDDVLLLPASRFLRPYSNKEKNIQNLKMSRIKREMTYAAKNNKIYHLWWHPHNFGDFPNENLNQLKELILHFNDLHKKYGFESVNMIETMK